MYINNREKLFAKLPENSVALIPSSEEKIRNRDVEYPFRVDSDFHYLTGFSEPDALLVMIKIQSQKTFLFLREKDPLKETWQGRRLGVEKAPDTLKIDQSFAIDSLHDEILPLIKGCEKLYFSFNELDVWTEDISQWIKALKSQARQGVQAPTQLCDLDDVLHEMRLFKSAEELAIIRKACQISVSGHLAAMKSAVNADYEYQVQAELEAEFRRQGSPRVAFNSIVASADNACILHYTENEAKIDKQALLLIDAGAEFEGYAGDITTTFPASGRFNKEQAALYSLVLEAQQAVIKMIKPGISYDEMHNTSLKVLTNGLVKLGILEGQVDTLIKDEAYKPFFMHGTGHWLGRDVHDVGRYKIAGEWRALEQGMVLTVEPGLYISSEHTSIDSKWHNIGIRIEDDILVNEQGCEVLTKGLPRTVAEIEAWMNN